MPTDIAKLAEAVKAKASKPGLRGDPALQAALRAIEALSSLVQLLMVEDQLTDINTKIENITGVKLDEPEGPKLSDAIAALAEAGTTRMKQFDGGARREFLLHRLTENFEYENAKKVNEYKTKAETQWSVEVGVAQLAQDRSEAALKGANPVISCWIPEAGIVSVSGAQANTGTWGDLGENPHKNSFSILVKPGKYEIYQELKQ